MCNTYFFKEHREEICYADTDIPLKGYQNSKREGEDKNRVGNRKVNGGNAYWNQWVYCKTLRISKNSGKVAQKAEKFEWDELFCIEFDLNDRRFNLSSRSNEIEKLSEIKILRRFIRPDLVLEAKATTVDYNFNEGKTIKIIDYKNVPLEFYKNKQLPPKSAKKYRDDLVKQLTYEYALQKTHNISSNEFFIPYYYDIVPSDPLGELEPELNLKGITVFRANFSLIQTIYLEENL